MEFTSREQRFIKRAEASRTGKWRSAAIAALVLGGLGGLLQIVVGVIDLIEGESAAGTRLGMGCFIIGFFLMLYAQTETADIAQSVVRKLRSAREGPGHAGSSPGGGDEEETG